MALEHDISAFGGQVGHALDKLRTGAGRSRAAGLRIRSKEKREHLAIRLETHAERLLETARMLRE